MSYFRGGNQGQPPQAPYSRVPAGPPAGSQSYNDPSANLFEKRADRRPPPPRSGPSGGRYAVVGATSDALALSNCIIVHPSDFQQGQHILVKDKFPCTARHDNTGKLQPGSIGAAAMHRQWIGLSAVGDETSVEALPSPPHPSAPAYLQSLDVEVGFLRPKIEVAEVFSMDEMSKNFLKAFNGIIFTPGQFFVFEFHGHNLKVTVKGLSLLELADEQRHGGRDGQRQENMGVLMDRTDVGFLKAGDSAIKIKSSAKKAAPNAILAPNFKFEDMGIGGLDSEFSSIFRRAFASRVFPPGLVEKLGIQHVKGILLHGPPGTGKTLLARQIGKMLNAREPKIVNGPEILNKYVGASEENIRKLFEDAEKEYKEKGDESGLHIIIFDELDAIFKSRGTSGGGTGVGDSVVNQLLSKMDGVDQLNNILIIGMTNRLDMIDEALLRPGRLEVHMEISLPDEQGRYQILNIHTMKMRVNGVMDDDVDLEELAATTKNFSGAEIGGLIKSATSFAFNRHVKVGTMAGISDDVENLRVNRSDFMDALNEVHPAFGVSEEELQQVIQNGIIHFDVVVDELLRSGKLFTDQVRTSTRTPLVSILLHGPPGSGKTALGATIAQQSQYPFIKLISPESMVGFNENQKVAAISKVFSDSYKSPLSVIVVDNIERLLGAHGVFTETAQVDSFDKIGHHWDPDSPMLSYKRCWYCSLDGHLRLADKILLPDVIADFPSIKGRRLLVIATSSLRPVLSEVGLSEAFDSELRVPPISSLDSLEYVLREVSLFKSSEDRKACVQMLREVGFPQTSQEVGANGLHIGVKKLLSIVEMARQEPENAAQRLVGALMGLGM